MDILLMPRNRDKSASSHRTKLTIGIGLEDTYALSTYNYVAVLRAPVSLAQRQTAIDWAMQHNANHLL